MSTITLTLLGTGTSQGIPVIACDCEVCKSSNNNDKRLRSSALIKTRNNILVIDAGPDFRQQMLRENVKKLDAILVTHDHKDHIGGLDDIRAFNWIHQKPMDIYATATSLKRIQNDFSYAFHAEKYPGVPEINLKTIDEQPFSINGDVIMPIKVLHGQLPVLGFRIGDLTYLTDASHITDEEKDKIKGSRVIVVNGLRKKKHHSHFTLDQAVVLLQELNPELGLITHISHQMGLHNEVNSELPAGIELGYDGLKITIGKNS